MSRDRKEGRRADYRAFRPAPDGSRLEPRLVMSHTPFVVDQYILTHPQPVNGFRFHKPPQRTPHTPPFARHDGANSPVYDKGFIATQTARGGQSVIVAAPDGSRFRVSLNLADNQFDGALSAETGGTGNNVLPSPVVQPRGTVRAYPMPGGKVGLIVDGSTEQEQLTIDPLPFAQRKGFAHSFAYGESGRSHVLNIGALNVTSGRIQAVLGFHSADLSGPLTIAGAGVVDRLAFNSLQPGAAIGVGGTLNTLDVLNTVTLTSGPGVTIGRDLNLFNVGGDVVIANGANFIVGRDVGQTLQPPKGTATGSNVLSLNIPTLTNGISTVQLQNPVGAYLQGNLIIGPNSNFTIVRNVDNQFRVLGSINDPTRFHVGGVITDPVRPTPGIPATPPTPAGLNGSPPATPGSPAIPGNPGVPGVIFVGNNNGFF